MEYEDSYWVFIKYLNYIKTKFINFIENSRMKPAATCAK
jgi:hypothetical protein